MATVAAVPPSIATAPTRRRPRGVGQTPAHEDADAPGVFVDRVKSVIFAAENPRSSRRNSFWNCEAGATKSATRKPETASSQTRLGRGPTGLALVSDLEPAALGETPGDRQGHRDPEKGDHVTATATPAPPYRPAGAPTPPCQSRGRPSWRGGWPYRPASSGGLLRGDDPDQQRHRGRHPSGERLAAAQPRETGRRRRWRPRGRRRSTPPPASAAAPAGRPRLRPRRRAPPRFGRQRA